MALPTRQDCVSFFTVSPATQALTWFLSPVQTSCKYYRSYMWERIAMSREENISFILDSLPIGEVPLDTWK